MSQFALRGANEDAFELSVVIEGRRKHILARTDETILSALERSGLQIQAPHDCRRGNCLTCSGKILAGPKDSLNEERDTHLPSKARQEGMILTCCSSVAGPGLSIEIGQNDKAWKIAYRDRFVNEETKQIGLEASAKAMRSYAEQYPDEWIMKVEDSF